MGDVKAETTRRSERLHPEVRTLLEKADAMGAPPVSSLTAVEARALRGPQVEWQGGERVALARVEDVRIAGPGGDIPIRVYASGEGVGRVALVYLHGGGFVLGNLETHDAVCRALAKESGAVVVAVDYRLAPEHRFPAGLEDAYAATLWVVGNAERLGIDAGRVVVSGDSAGATLATVIAMRCRDRGGPVLAGQLLVYPVTDVSSFETGSYRECAQGYALTKATMEWFGEQYVGSREEARDPEASPLLAKDLSGLPRTLVMTAEFDPLRDEGESFAERLTEAGVDVRLSRYAGMIHGFFCMRRDLSVSHEAIAEAAEFVRSVGA